MSGVFLIPDDDSLQAPKGKETFGSIREELMMVEVTTHSPDYEKPLFVI